MGKFKKFVATSMIAASASAGLGVVSITPAFADVCGWSPIMTKNVGGQDDGHYEKGAYNHCAKSETVKIRVDYTYAHDELCVTNGKTTLYADPNKGAITNAYAIGKC